MKNKKDIQVLYAEKFSALEGKAYSDPEIKKQVFNTVERLRNLAEVIDLFTTKFISSNSTIIDSLINPNKN